MTVYDSKFSSNTQNIVMNILSKILKSEQNRSRLALDVGTESAKAIIFTSDKREEKITVKGIGIKRHRAGDMHGGIVFNLEGVIETSRKAIKDAENTAKSKPSSLIISIGGEYSKNITQTKSFIRKDEKTRISMEELGEMLCKAQNNVSNYSDGILKWGKARLISADVVDFSIDGYRVINPVNFKGKNIRISISNSYVTEEQYEQVKTIASKLNLALAGVSYGPYAVLKAIGAQDIMKFSAIFIDIGGGTTDVVIVRNRNIEDDRFFIFGGKAFTKNIADKMGLEFSMAEKVKLDYSNGNITGELKEQVKDIINSDLDKWSIGVGISLEDLSKNNLLPSKILLYGGGSHLLGAKEAVEKLIRENRYAFSDKPEIGFINPSDIINTVNATGNTMTMQLVTAISLANLSLDLANEEDFPNRILKKCFCKI